MNLSKVRRLHVIALGSAACVIVAVGFFFLLIKPVLAQKSQVSKELAASEEVGFQKPSAIRELEEANRVVSMTQATFAAYERSKMPNLSFAQRDLGMVGLWHEQVEVLGPLLVSWAPRGGVRLMSEISIPPPTTNPNDLTTDLMKVAVGKVSVRGDFKSILNHIRAWNACPRLVQVDKPSISGFSPFLGASYDLTVYIFPRGAAGPQIQMAGAGAGGAAGGEMGGAGVTPPPAMGNAPPEAGAEEGRGLRGRRAMQEGT